MAEPLRGYSVRRRKNINGDLGAHEHATTVPSKTTQSMSRQPFEIGDQVVFIPDPVPSSERVVDIEWLDAPVPHWQVTTISWIDGLEFRRVADAAEFRPARTSSRVVSQ